MSLTNTILLHYITILYYYYLAEMSSSELISFGYTS